MTSNSVNFFYHYKFHYFKSNQVPTIIGVSNQEIKKARAKVSLLSMQTGIFRFQICKQIIVFICIVIAFLSFFLVIPMYVKYGKAYGLLYMSLFLFGIAFPACWQYTQPCKLTNLLRKQLLDKMENHVYDNGQRIH